MAADGHALDKALVRRLQGAPPSRLSSTLPLIVVSFLNPAESYEPPTALLQAVVSDFRALGDGRCWFFLWLTESAY